MELENIITLLSYTLPSVVTGLVAYYFFVNHTKNEERKLRLSILKENQKQALPIKLQAYERMTLYLERINPSNLVVRIASNTSDKVDYSNKLIKAISDEFDHNIAQQIYISENCWNVIIASKNATMEMIKKATIDSNVSNAQELRESIIKQTFNKATPSSTSLTYIKEEVRNII